MPPSGKRNGNSSPTPSPSQPISWATLADYLNNRDDSRPTRGAPPRWCNTSVTFAAQAWTLSHRGITQRGAKVRHLWDLRWYSENQAVAAADPNTITSHCTILQTHIICDCPGLAQDRAGLHLVLTIRIGQLPEGPAGRWGAPTNTLSSTDPILQSVVSSGPVYAPRTTGCSSVARWATAPSAMAIVPFLP